MLNQFSASIATAATAGNRGTLRRIFADISEKNNACVLHKPVQETRIARQLLRLRLYTQGGFILRDTLARAQRWHSHEFLSYSAPSKRCPIYVWHFKDVTSALKTFPFNACSRTRAGATVYTVFYSPLCTVRAHWAVHYTFMSTFVAVCWASAVATKTAVGQGVHTRTTETQAIPNPSSTPTQAGSADVFTCAWNRCAPSLLVHCCASHLCQGAWRLCPRLTYA